ncbi:hypothetical protein CRE_22366 [Caenorhabditis remanei]|uniref:SET domain-containing protein n=1 Tax=Caenorhabditis remanei TaxID=31234 RepID=E3MEC1_CAERE|nr:hypothetical protein CRE_22366 [Caenorhabditis remanei]
MAPAITRSEQRRQARIDSERAPTQPAQHDRARPSTQAQRPARPSSPPRDRSVQSSTHHRGDSSGRGNTSSRGRSQPSTSSRDNAPRPPSTTPYRRAQSRVRFDTSPRRHSQRSPLARDNRRRSPSPVQYRRYPSRAGRLNTQSPDRQSRHSPDRNNRRQSPPRRGDRTDPSARSRNVSPARRSPSTKRSKTQASTATQSSRQAHGRDVCSSDRNRSISMSPDARDNRRRSPSPVPYRRNQSRVRFDISPRRDGQRSPPARDNRNRSPSSARDNRRRSPSARDNRRRSPSPVPYRRNQSRVRFDISPRRDDQRSPPARDNRRRSPSPVQHRRYPSRAGRLNTQSPDRQSRHSPDRNNRRQSPPRRGDRTYSSGRSRNVSPARRSPSPKRSRTQPSISAQSSRQAHGRDVRSSDRNRSISMSPDENRAPRATTSSSIRAGPSSPLQGTSSGRNVSLSPDGRQPPSPISLRTPAQTRTRASSRNRSISMSPPRHRTPSPVRNKVLPVQATPTSPARPSTSSDTRSSGQTRNPLTSPVRRGASSSIGRQTRSQVRASAPPPTQAGPSTSARGGSSGRSSSASPVVRRTRSAVRSRAQSLARGSPPKPRYNRARSVPAPRGPNRKWIAVDTVLKKVVVSPENFLEGPRFEKLKELSEYEYRKFGKQIEDDQVDETKDMYCEECDAYFRPSCKEHPVHRIEDAIVTLPLPRGRTNAEMTVPARYMYIANSRIPNAGKGVFAKDLIPVGFLFGPYKGKKIRHRRNLESNCYAFLIKTSDTRYYRDATDESRSNWLRFVNAPLRGVEPQLNAIQIGRQIFFRVVKAIEPHQEMFVPYGNSFRIPGVN